MFSQEEQVGDKDEAAVPAGKTQMLVGLNPSSDAARKKWLESTEMKWRCGHRPGQHRQGLGSVLSCVFHPFPHLQPLKKE